jgi:hypothetical protein
VLSGCSTPELLTRTRDIVNVAAGGGGAPALRLNACGTTTRGLVTTRDIQKVAADGTTSFALDPISVSEAASGQLSARVVSIVFHHQ